MAYINGREVLFSPIVNGVLVNDETLQQADIYKKIFANEPLDLVVPDGVTVLCAEQNLLYAPITTVSASGKDVEEISGGFFISTNVATVDFPKLKIINDSAFQNCTNLTEINAPLVTTIGADVIYDSPNITNIVVGVLTSTDKFSFRQGLSSGSSNLTVLEVGNGTSADLYLQYSNKYTQATLHKIIENLADLSERETAGNFIVGEVNIEKIDAEHIAMLENKNWIYH